MIPQYRLKMFTVNDESPLWGDRVIIKLAGRCSNNYKICIYNSDEDQFKNAEGAWRYENVDGWMYLSELDNVFI